MNEKKKRELARIFAQCLLLFRDAVDDMTLMSGDGVLTLEELCHIGREAIMLIEEGKVK